MNKTPLWVGIDIAAARAQAFEHMPVTEVPMSVVREQLRQAEIDVGEILIRRDTLRTILKLREIDELNRTRAIIAKFYP
jgi:hypothetical protein